MSNNNTADIEYINNVFKLPIYYNDKKQTLKQNIINDLELIDTIDPSSNSMYSFLFNSDNNNNFSRKITEQIAETYTTDTKFLKDSQTLLKIYKKTNKYNTDISNNYEKIIDIWHEIKNDTGFKEKYYYIDWPMWEFLNKSDKFLQFMSVYNLTAPLISIFIPIIILIIPFFIIKLRGLNISMSQYIEILKLVISNNAIGRLFTQFNEVSAQEKMYLIVSAFFYVFSIYQNFLTCIRFNNNMIKIHEHLSEINKYIIFTTKNMNNYLMYSGNLQSHSTFNTTVREKMNILLELGNKINCISKYEINLLKVCEIGYVLKYFYEIYDNKIFEEAFMYSFGFNGYTDCIEGLIENIESKHINFTKFIKDKKKNVIKNNYYAALKNKLPIKNNIKFKKNIIITGPNASGKTTILKSTLINIIITQQFGCGFYDSACLKPYEHIHCYLNIPDTSGRDSLFQAEARRCKEIIDNINENIKDNHFCAFDELYSGTNPIEAEISAIAFMEYLVKNKNVSCFLTTHFINVCKKLDSNKQIINCYMDANKENDKIVYKYILKEGISELKGGLNVLYDMDYPVEIINSTKQKQSE
jgi:hypothetical protein